MTEGRLPANKSKGHKYKSMVDKASPAGAEVAKAMPIRDEPIYVCDNDSPMIPSNYGVSDTTADIVKAYTEVEGGKA